MALWSWAGKLDKGDEVERAWQLEEGVSSLGLVEEVYEHHD